MDITKTLISNQEQLGSDLTASKVIPGGYYLLLIHACFVSSDFC